MLHVPRYFWYQTANINNLKSYAIVVKIFGVKPFNSQHKKELLIKEWSDYFFTKKLRVKPVTNLLCPSPRGDNNNNRAWLKPFDFLRNCLISIDPNQ